jgi:hypothetical protein
MVIRVNRRRIRELVRQFKENGMKMMLEHPANVRDLLGLLHLPWLDQIDFGRLEQIKTTFVRRDYRHLESDIVLTAPLAGRVRSRKKLLIYVLIEHQSKSDRLMPLRLVDTQTQIYRYQLREWSRTHSSLTNFSLMPVLPVVFYTGLDRWRDVGTLADLMERGEEFREVTPIVERPLFLSLPEVSPDQLEHDGGFFGWVLRLVQQRKTRGAEFQQLLQRVVTHLEGMAPAERLRWLDLLSYIDAMIYHERSPGEQTMFHQTLAQSVENDELRQEVSAMGKTMADVLIEKGERQGLQKGERKAGIQTRQQTLVRLLRRRFEEVPAEIVRAVQATHDIDRLDQWLDRFATASSLEELEIPAAH